MTTKELSGRQAWWVERLTVFDFIIEHCPGTKNPTDAPSHQPDYVQGEKDRSMLPTLQEKLRRGLVIAEELQKQSSELHSLLIGALVHGEE